MRTTLGAIAIIGLLAFGYGCSRSDPAAPATASPDDGAKALFEHTCTECHSTVRIENHQGETPWDGVVKRMIERNGAKITRENATKIVSYLKETFPQSKT